MRELAALLKEQPYEGYPTDYLLARIRGRRATLPSAWPGPGAGGEAAEGTLQQLYPSSAGTVTAAAARAELRAELRWAYRQMDDGMRLTFAPFFFWVELGTIILVNRFRRTGQRERSAPLLAASLLGQRLRQLLAREGEPAPLFDELGVLLGAVCGPCRELGGVYRQRGGRAWEEQLVRLFLERMTEAPLHPVLAEFFRALIDLRNLMVLAKQLRWQLHDPEAFARGGEIPPKRLQRVLAEGTPTLPAALLGLLPGMAPPAAAPANPEPLLLHWLTRRVRQLAREPGGIGLILDYLWQRIMTARNLGLVFHGTDLERPALHAELTG
jgi:hypothetical protein